MEQVVQFLVFSVGLCREEVLAPDLAFQVEGQPPFLEQFLIKTIFRGRGFDVARDLGLGEVEVGHADHEEVLAADVYVELAREHRLAR
ncbi:hypothetical protein D9M68_872200 [compost metagenome]